MTVNNFFWHWFTEIDIKRDLDDMGILPTNDSEDIYQYSNAKMKYLPAKWVKKLVKTILYSNDPVYLTKNVDKRLHNDNSEWTELIQI